MDHTVHMEAYIPYVLRIPSSRAWKDLVHELQGITFLFSRSGITEDGITDDFLRAIVSGLFPFCMSGQPGATVKA